ncbi:GNAT family N-acetyltransferase [Alteromonas sp. A079]|uniref:GNAT family N-acetyltransferase n=1 Tax=Alteromonas sp. A079 TaxID=3410268 RepID=UPI003B9FACB6
MLTTKWVDNIEWSVLSSFLDELCPTNSGPFLTSHFLQSWVISKQASLCAFVLFEDEKPVCMVLIGRQTKRKFGFKINVAVLNQAGNAIDDQIWIEYNSLIGNSQYHSIFFNELINALANRKFDMLSVSMSEGDHNYISQHQQRYINKHTILGYTTQLNRHTTQASLTEKLSANSRSKVRRSERKLRERFGELRIEVADNDEQRHAFFNDLSKIHIARWGSTPEGSGFENSVFLKTIKKLAFEHYEFTDIAKVTAGEFVLGYTLNFIFNDTVYFYCSGINNILNDKHIKPGYTMHLHLMAYYAALGYRQYDFMGGDSQYKRTLADKTVEFNSVSLTLDTLTGRAIRAANKLVKGFRKFKALLKPSLGSHQQ